MVGRDGRPTCPIEASPGADISEKPSRISVQSKKGRVKRPSTGATASWLAIGATFNVARGSAPEINSMRSPKHTAAKREKTKYEHRIQDMKPPGYMFLNVLPALEREYVALWSYQV